MLRYLLNLLLWILPTSRFFSFRRICLRLARVNVGKKVSVCGHGWLYGRGKLTIGDHSGLSPGVIFYTHPNAPIMFESNCDIGPEVVFITGGHVIGNLSRRAGEGTAKPIMVGKGVWIGARSVILGGVTIGEGCVIAAGSVVTKNTPSNVLIAGVPARIKRHLSQ